MRSTRTERTQRHQEKRKALYIAVGATAAAVAAVLATGALFWGTGRAPVVTGADGDLATMSAASTATPTTTPTAAGTQVVEVPDVCGQPVAEGELLLTYAGLTVAYEGATTATDGVILGQSPEAGVKLNAGQTVTLRIARKASKDKAKRPKVVCIDPGHQERTDDSLEPVGPGAKKTSQKAKGGVTGAYTKREEYQVALEISRRLKERLEAAGVKVVMTRTKNDVDISNAERAEIANKAGADAFVRIHGDSSLEAKGKGISTLYAGGNSWTKPIEGRSKRLAERVQKATARATGAKDRGIDDRSDMTGFNWSKVPAILVHAGFLTNAEEDRLLSNPQYQEKLAEGMAEGILDYLGGGE